MSQSFSKDIKNQVNQNRLRWKETQSQMNNYKTVKSEKLTVGNIISLLPLNNFNSDVKNGAQSEIKVFHNPLLEVVEAAINNNFKPLVLNSISECWPRDALREGTGGMTDSDEYEILRRTNFHNTLIEQWFPLTSHDIIYSPKVYMFRTSEYKTYRQPIKFSLISICPLKTAKLISVRSKSEIQDIYENPQDEKNMFDKINSIFTLASLKKHDCLILSDFGCKSKNNPSNKIVEFFNQFIQTSRIPYVFFAVYNVDRPHVDENFLYFHKFIQRSPMDWIHPSRSVIFDQRPKNIVFAEPTANGILKKGTIKATPKTVTFEESLDSADEEPEEL